MFPSPDFDESIATAAERGRNTKNLVLVDEIIGAAICLLLASTAAWIARGRTVAAIGVGLIGGALGGALGGFLGASINHFDGFPESAIMVRPPLVHATLWILVAAFLALAIAIGTRRGNTASLFGRLALYSLIAAAVYPLIASIAFPLSNSDQPIPEGLANTALWIALPAALFAFAIAQANRQSEVVVSSTPAVDG
jgi:hypothetical protein